MLHTLRSLFASSKSSSRSTRAVKPSRPQIAVEQLEAREVFSVSQLWFSGNLLVVQADNAPTSVTVSSSGSNIVIREVGTTRSWSYASSQVGKVEFQGGAGNDRFVNNVSALPVNGFGNGGDDYLEGYNGADTFVGGDGNDTLVGYGGDDKMWGGNGDDTLKGMAGNDSLVGGTGNDRLIGGDGDDTMWGEDGFDTLVGGAGTDTMYGGNGDDTLVAIDGGTSDYADGQAGRDTIWRDKTGWWIFSNYDRAYGEKMQDVSSFSNGADLSLNGDGIADPTDGTFYKNFSNNPLFGRFGPRSGDIDQQDLGDCWMMASLGSVADDSPSTIRSMVADFGDGTYGVRLGNNFYRVDADLPTWNATSTDQRFAGLGNDNSLWVALVEKAYASFRRGQNTYASLSGGDPADALRAVNLTSVGLNYYAAGSNATTLANDVFSKWNNWQSATICTGTVTAASGLIGNHCYTVISVSRNSSGTVTSMVLRNPWGNDDTSNNPFVTITPANLAACQIWLAFGTA